MTMSTMVQVVAGLLLTASILGALAAIGKAALYVFGVLRRMGRWLDDWEGEPPRAGLPNGRPGVLDRIASIESSQSTTAGTLSTVEQRLAALEAQMYPNTGGSLRDAVDRAAAAIDGVAHGSEPPIEQPAVTAIVRA